MQKTLLVLGASDYQCDAIRAARSLGYRVVVVDRDPENPGHRLAQVAYVEDTRDREAVLRLAKRERIDGILAFATDVAVPTQAHVAASLGLAGPPPSAARRLTDKAALQELLARAGAPTLPSVILGAEETPDPEIFDRGVWVMRPDRSSGGKGSFIVTSSEQYHHRRAETGGFAAGGRVVLQPFVDGHQGTIEGVYHEGGFPAVFFSDRRPAEPPHVATTGHRVPSSLAEALQARALASVARMFDALAVTSTPFDCDFVATPDQVFVLELTPRLGGNSICRLIQAASGVDLLAYAIRAACGDATEPPASAPMRPTALALLQVQESGTLDYDRAAAEALAAEPWVVRLRIDLPAGSPVERFRHGRHRVGEILVQAERPEELSPRLLEATARLALRARRPG